jgi:hypothetical protein
MCALWTVYMGPASSIHISNCANLTFSVKYYSLLAHNVAFVGNSLPTVRRKCLLLSGHWLRKFFEQVTRA